MKPKKKTWMSFSIFFLLVAGTQILPAESRCEAKPLNIWFAPTRPAVQANGRHTGSADYDQLFEPGAPWQRTAAAISVFKTYQSFIINSPIPLLHQAFTFLAAHGIKLAVEFGPMSKLPGQCWINAEGWGVGGYAAASRLANKIRAAGGTLDYISMDEPYWNGRIRPPAGSCEVTPIEMAENAKLSVDAIHAVFPQAQFGDTEPVQPLPGVNLNLEYAQWLDAWQRVMGTPLAFFHMDVLWDSTPDQMIASLARVVHSRRVPFGLIYNGYAHDQANSDWLEHAQARYLRYERGNDPIPDQPVFQSWNFYPDRVMPETDPDAHTHLILDYMQRRMAAGRGYAQ